MGPGSGLRPSLSPGSRHTMGSGALGLPLRPGPWKTVSHQKSCNNVSNNNRIAWPRELGREWDSHARKRSRSPSGSLAGPRFSSLCLPFSWRLRNQVWEVLQTQFPLMKHEERQHPYPQGRGLGLPRPPVAVRGTQRGPLLLSWGSQMGVGSTPLVTRSPLRASVFPSVKWVLGPPGNTS